MGEATTTNPWLVSLINMTIVFIVLIVLWGIMHVLYMVDPTKKKEEKKEEASAPVVEEVAAPAEEEVAAVAAATEAEEVPVAAPAAAPKAAPAGATTVAAPMPGKISKINFLCTATCKYRKAQNKSNCKRNYFFYKITSKF